MYLPQHFEESRIDVLHASIRKNPFGTLVVATNDGFEINHVPFLLDESVGPFGLLYAHVARANPVWQMASTTVDAAVVFQGPDRYITPSWYPTKQETSKVVPTWNYAVVHAHGRIRFIEDPSWLRAFVSRLTNHFEAPRPQPWKVADAPSDYIEGLLGSIVGIELPITRLLGKWKLSQNQPERNRDGVVDGLLREGDPVASDLASIMRPQ